MFAIAVLSLSLTVSHVVAGQAQTQRRLEDTQRSLEALTAAISAEHLTVTVDPQGRATITPQNAPPQVVVPPSSGSPPATAVVPDAGPVTTTPARSSRPSPTTTTTPPPGRPGPPLPPVPSVPAPSVPQPTPPHVASATLRPG